MFHVAYVLKGRAACPNPIISHPPVVKLTLSRLQALRSYSGLIVDHPPAWQKGKDVCNFAHLHFMSLCKSHLYFVGRTKKANF